MDNENLHHLRELLHIRTENLRKLELQAANYGENQTPLSIMNQMKDEREAINKLQQQLQAAGYDSPERLDKIAPKSRKLFVGAHPEGDGTFFRVWAANAKQVEVAVFSDNSEDIAAFHALLPDEEAVLPDYFKGYVPSITPGSRYKYRLNGDEIVPDPASRYQPNGVHGPSEVVDLLDYDWTDQNWIGVALEDLIIYEIHVGTATREGTFDALINRLGAIRELGATAILLMPVADFAGERNWGYDGVCLFAPSHTYGGPEALQRLVDAAHARGLAIILDVVFNHVGPDGSYLERFSTEYFTERDTGWGKGFNFDGKSGRSVRDFFVYNARYWARYFHIDGLRLDAIRAIKDGSEPHILAEIVTGVQEILSPDRLFITLAEDQNNDPLLLQPTGRRGFGIDAVIADDFHHQIYVALSGYQGGFYVDFGGTTQELVKTLQEGWYFTGQYSRWFEGKRGSSATKVDAPVYPSAIIHSLENHDQIGNRPDGKRLNHLYSWDIYRAVSTLLLISPYTPLLFMGQEWAASSPFFFFTDHHDELGQQITVGRKGELEVLFPGISLASLPNPQELTTFLLSKLNWNERKQEKHAQILRLYRDLIQLRRDSPALREPDRGNFNVIQLGKITLALQRFGATSTLLTIVHLGGSRSRDLSANRATKPPHGRIWQIRLSTEDPQYGGNNDVQLVDDQLILNRPCAVILEAK
jgi:maltooligosyltrehalose trehalohydrolase